MDFQQKKKSCQHYNCHKRNDCIDHDLTWYKYRFIYSQKQIKILRGTGIYFQSMLTSATKYYISTTAAAHEEARADKTFCLIGFDHTVNKENI